MTGLLLCLPPRTAFVSDMIEAEIVQHHCVPVVILELTSNMSSDVMVDLREVLTEVSNL